ncbi:unnamed protein product [Cuscuta europaea]|uniref:TFIIS N-terminal domain-containing protein n=1 Tax=Cuscuta europaea TaxID=41803 RepID=A0A9P0ZGZ3_CUSEU|nr:unnamed protein product [Cuscuta europaea]
MGENSNSLDEWRVYFKSANADIFDIIEHAITVAALDKPNELTLNRARIAEKLFTCKTTTLCSTCRNVELVLRPDDSQTMSQTTELTKLVETDKSKERKMNDDRLDMELNASNQISNGSCYADAEALSDEIEEISKTVNEVLRIKQIIDNHQEEPDYLVIDSLRRLQLMALSVEILKVTNIGKSVNAIRKHKSDQIKHVAQALIGAWKEKADEWVLATEALTECMEGKQHTPESGKEKASAVEEVEEEEEGLPSPPMDEGAFFTTSTMDLSGIFDDLDEDGNLRNSEEFYKKCESVRKQPKRQEAALHKPSTAFSQERHTKPQKEDEAVMKKSATSASQERHAQKPKAEEAVMKKPAVISASEDWFTPLPKEKESTIKKPTTSRPNKPSANGSGSQRLVKPTVEHKATITKRPAVSQQSKVKCPDEDSLQARLEVAKRKLKERYESVEYAKRQRTTQFVQIHDIPKRGLGNKNAYVKPGYCNKQ